MNELSSQARQLIALARRGDDPSFADQKRVDQALAKSIGLGASGATTAVGFGKMVVITAIGVTAALALGQSPPAPVGVRSALTHPTQWQEPPRSHVNQPQESSTDNNAVLVPNNTVAESEKGQGSLHARSPSQSRDFSMNTAQKRAPVASFQDLSEAGLRAKSGIDPLLAETAALRDAQRAMRSGDPARAIALVDKQDRQYPTGSLRQERAAARIFALCALGQVAQARTQARAFEQHWPRSPMLTRVQTSCGAP